MRNIIFLVSIEFQQTSTMNDRRYKKKKTNENVCEHEYEGGKTQQTCVYVRYSFLIPVFLSNFSLIIALLATNCNMCAFIELEWYRTDKTDVEFNNRRSKFSWFRREYCSLWINQATHRLRFDLTGKKKNSEPKINQNPENDLFRQRVHFIDLPVILTAVSNITLYTVDVTFRLKMCPAKQLRSHNQKETQFPNVNSRNSK